MKKIILDTHIFIWMITKNEKIQVKTHQLIEAASKDQRLYLSTISLWEIATLVRKDRLKLTMPVRSWIEKSITASGIKLLQLTSEILIESSMLPDKLHSDPADRMIIATTQLENAVLVTRDTLILNYAKEKNIEVLKG